MSLSPALGASHPLEQARGDANAHDDRQPDRKGDDDDDDSGGHHFGRTADVSDCGVLEGAKGQRHGVDVTTLEDGPQYEGPPNRSGCGLFVTPMSRRVQGPTGGHDQEQHSEGEVDIPQDGLQIVLGVSEHGADCGECDNDEKADREQGTQQEGDGTPPGLVSRLEDAHGRDEERRAQGGTDGQRQRDSEE